ncbi:thioredoxin domain-containing protein [Robertkochia aurantiaca]|uniref:thioredoxin domain-containing protein n=1 Tax=Robertkochia aurantiaca TaxID=2873700 RepID=UPI001CCBDC47|nr:thioredoxin domain-containing protein [Robertkochia sp. 3YJGBD-33]
MLVACGTEEKDNSADNRLADASSPYLREHADNPVHWMEWGEEALAKAKKENKPLLISIGYASCHWCHVMEEESFMDSIVAQKINTQFVPVKVDREERPDIDMIYMNAAMLLNGRGGWPLNVFALPGGEPFFAGTYFPKEQWLQVLEKVHETWTNKESTVREQAEKLTRGIKSRELIEVEATESEMSKKDYQNLFPIWKEYTDAERGGFNQTQKFPMPAAWEFLMQYAFLTGEEEPMELVTTTLNHMSAGGIYDHLGGGFARYATDPEWKVPHFEKMLYDNAQLLSLYSKGFKITENPEYARVVKETAAFMNRRLRSPEGGFFSSLNADSEGEEGRYYVWKDEDLRNLLSDAEYDLISAYYQTSEAGNWESGKNVLYIAPSQGQFSGAMDESELKLLQQARNTLLIERQTRIRPSTDNKILTSWNALAISGFLEAYKALGDESYLNTARETAGFILESQMSEEGALKRNRIDGQSNTPAMLDDYAFLAKALIDLYETDFEIQWLESAKTVTDYAIAHFYNDESGIFYYTGDSGSDLITRNVELEDGVTPSSNGIMSQVLFRLGNLLQDPEMIKKSERMIAVMQDRIERNSTAYPSWAVSMGLMAYQPFEIAIMGENALKLNHDLQANYLPTAIFMGGEDENLPLLKNKKVPGETLIYVCRSRVCKLPVRSPEAALDQVRNFRKEELTNDL